MNTSYSNHNYRISNAIKRDNKKKIHRCQSKAGVSINALILLSSSALLVGGASGSTLLDWTGTTSGISYKSPPRSSHSESSGYKIKLRHIRMKSIEMAQLVQGYHSDKCNICETKAYIFRDRWISNWKASPFWFGVFHPVFHLWAATKT